MNKQEYIERLSDALGGVSDVEKEEIIYDFSEYFENAKLEGLSEQQVIEELGDPKQLAEEFNQNNPKEIKKDIEIESIQKENKEKFRKDFAFELKDIKEFNLISGSEDIFIIPSDDEIKIDYLMKKNRTRLKPEFIVKEENGIIDFEIKYPRISRFLLGGVRFKAKIRIHVPEYWAGKLNIKNIAGDIKSFEVSLPFFKFNTISGDIKTNLMKIDELFIRTVSGDIKTERLECKRMEMKTTSGDIKCEQIDVEDLTFRTVSGDIKTNANINHLYFKSVSGDMKTNFLKTPNDMRFKTVSGDISIRIPSNSGIELESKTVSGKLKTDFPFTEKEKNSKKHFIGSIEGKNIVKIDCKSVSGDVRLKALKEED